MTQWKTAAIILASCTSLSALAQTADISVAFDGDGGTSLTLAGDDTSFIVTISNAGPNDATNVMVDLALPDGTTATGVDTTCASTAGGFPCSVGTLASGASVSLAFTVNWPAPTDTPATCPTNLALGVTVSAAEDTTAANNTATLADVTVPVTVLSGTASGPDEPLTDGGDPTSWALPGDTVEYSGTVSNDGPCAVPAGGLTIDASADDTSSWGLTFVSGSGDCSDWAVSTPASTSDGVCTVAAAVAPGAKVNFKLKQKIGALAPAGGLPDGGDQGGDSIMQSAATFNYAIVYAGNLGSSSPTTTTLIKGPGSSCSAVGGLSLLGSLGLALMLRRRKAR